jgi:GNAT superfamily N-acetyltransferase
LSSADSAISKLFSIATPALAGPAARRGCSGKASWARPQFGLAQVYLCAIDETKVVGFASMTIKNNLWRLANLGHIDEMIVDEKHRGSGLGTQLLQEIIEHARRRGCVRVELDSSFHRKMAHAFYERNGFENRAYLFSKRLD